MKKGLAILLVLMTAGYAGCSFLFPVYSIRFRLTSTIRSDGVDHQATGVIECSYRILPDNLAFAGAGVFSGEMRGFAVTASINRKEILYLINARPMLANDNGSALYPRGSSYCSLPFAAFGFQGEGPPSTMQQILKKFPSSGSAALSNSELPMVVWFGNSNDIGAAEEVDPNDLSSIGRAGAKIVQTKLEITKDAISPKPTVWPEWLSKTTLQNIELNGHLQMPVSIYYKMFEGE